MKRYILSVDQSTQGTKGLLFDEMGRLTARADRPHRQIITPAGWVEHDPEEILRNTLAVCRDVVKKAGIEPSAIVAMGISNQRETAVAWDRETGEPAMNAIVWQCARAAAVCARHEAEAERIRETTGLRLSPYFPALKFQWMLENDPQVREKARAGRLALGTVDAWLIFRLTKERSFKTDVSNASRTQLMNLGTLDWDAGLLGSFGISEEMLPEISMSDAVFGTTDLGGFLERPIPVRGVLGDSHGALFGQNCRRPGELKATYGTGSSVMMNIGGEPRLSKSGLVTSVAWGLNGRTDYVFEGNLNYTGAVISWLKDDVGLIADAADTEKMARAANPDDRTYFVPAFTGLGSPYWDPEATGLFTGITRTTGRNELVRACLECIAHQITDLVERMREESGLTLPAIRVDGGPTANAYLMRFQSDAAGCAVQIPELQELSGMGAAYAAGIAAGLYDPEAVFGRISYTSYEPSMAVEAREARRSGWREAVSRALAHGDGFARR